MVRSLTLFIETFSNYSDFRETKIIVSTKTDTNVKFQIFVNCIERKFLILGNSHLLTPKIS